MPVSISVFGNAVSLYYLFWFIAVAVALLISAMIAKDYGYSPYKGITLSSVALIMGLLLIWMTSLIFDGFNLIRTIAFLPLLYYLEALVFKEPYKRLTDFLTPMGVTCFGITHFGCMFPGCCHGFPSSWGIYSNTAETVCFPVQPLEAVVSIAIGMLMLLMAKKKWQQGKLLFWMMTLFGSTRFFLEFLRDNPKLWGNVSELALHALATFVVGVVGLILVTYFDKRRCNNEKN